MRRYAEVIDIRERIEAMKRHTWAAGEASPYLNRSLVAFDQRMLPCSEDFVKEEALFAAVLEIPWARG